MRAQVCALRSGYNSGMDIFRQVSEETTAGGAVALCTIMRSSGSTPRRAGSRMLVFPDGRTEGSVGGGELESRVIAAALQSIRSGQPDTLVYSLADPGRGDPGVCGGTVEILVDPILPEPTIIVAGGGHVGKAVAELALWLGYRVVLSDDREAFASAEAVAGAHNYHHGPLSELPANVPITPYSYLVLTTRNVMVDVEGLPALLNSEAAFIGVIGSKRRWKTTREKLLAAGVSEAQVDRVVSPIGIELNAETPEEIALSILAEIVMLRRGGDGNRMGVL